ncbi:MAG TPA: hypothetical protein VFV83_00055, partial [Chthoniobacteraceae bacterium]|nr:hypothetical protein [Chthoniobacteraceae bacterium]
HHGDQSLHAWPGVPRRTNATAFPLRQSGRLNVRLAFTWSDPTLGDGLTRAANEVSRLLRPNADERIYANFQTYTAKNGAAAVYGVNFSRLAAHKQNMRRRISSRATRTSCPGGV